MCGIAASVDLRSRGRARTWALDLMRHRGPDDEGYLLVNTRTARTVMAGGRDTRQE